MSVSGTIIVGEFPAGNPGSVGEPLGLWNAQATLTGDASGGFVNANFEPQNPTTTPALPDHRLRYLYFVDGVRATASTAGNAMAIVIMHMERSNSGLANPFAHRRAVQTIADGTGLFIPSRPLLDPQLTRMPLYWRPQELLAENILLQLFWENNVLAATYRFDCYGRYYDLAVVGQRGFGRLISPAAVSQFEG